MSGSAVKRPRTADMGAKENVEGGGGAPPARAAPSDADRPETPLLLRASAFGNETGSLASGEFEPGAATVAKLRGSRVLVLGAGGLGCELLKGLALSGITDVHVIDADTIDLSNLNRQFLFREADIGRPKATVAAEFIMKRVPSCRVTPHQCLIQTKDPDWFRQFGVVIGGLDNIIARRWMNATLCSLVSLDADGEIDDPATIIPYIDGGTEGFGGQVGVMLPRITACFECTMNLFPPPVTFAMCTIAETPRKPEHCIAYVMMKTWDASFPDRKLDADNPEDVSWVLAKALERGAAYGIEGVTHALTLGVLKNIIPAIASTNALVASLCVLEALKLLSFASQTLDNYCTYRGSEGTYSRTYANERAPSCAACAPSPSVHLTMARSMTLEGLVQQLKTLPALQLPAPSLGMPGKLLYNPRPHGAQVAYFAYNLAQTLPELGVNDGDVITCTDAELASLTSLCVHIKYEE